RDGGADPAAVRGFSQMPDALGGDPHRPVGVAVVAQFQGLPVKASDAAGGVAPSDAGAVFEFGESVIIGAVGADRGGHSTAAGREFGGAAQFGVALVQEAVGFVGEVSGVGEVGDIRETGRTSR